MVLLELFYPKKEIRKMYKRIKWENRKDLMKIEKKTLFLGGFSALVWLGIASFLQLNELVLAGVFFAILFGPFIGVFLWQLYLVEKKKNEKEKLVADFLLHAAIFPSETPLEKIIKQLGKEKNLLGREFRKAFSEIQKGCSVENALNNISKRNSSNIIKKMIELFKLSYFSKAKMNAFFKEAAEDIMQMQAIIEEKNATVIIQKYTLILAGAILVPAVLGLLSGMIGSLDFSIINSLELGTSFSERKRIVESALIGTQIYIAEYAIIASIFLGQQEGKPKKAFIYCIAMLPLSFASFYLTKMLL